MIFSLKNIPKISKTIKIDLLIIFISIVFFFAGYIIKGNKLDAAKLTKQETHESGFKYISPLLDCLTPAEIGHTKSEFKDKVQDIINQEISKQNIDHISLYLRDLNNGPWLGYNEKEKFSPASLMKVPLLISYLKLAEVNPEILEMKITIIPEYSKGFDQNIVPVKKIEHGKSYTVKELLNYMIIYSDNLATNTLINNIDQEFLGRIYADLNLSMPRDNQENFMTVLDYAAFFRILYNSTYLNREMSEYALALLSQSTFRDGIVAGVPGYVSVSHKFGERILSDSKQLHDCGIVYRNNSNYLICIMTRGDDFKKMELSIQLVSKYVYDNF